MKEEIGFYLTNDEVPTLEKNEPFPFHEIIVSFFSSFKTFLALFRKALGND